MSARWKWRGRDGLVRVESTLTSVVSQRQVGVCCGPSEGCGGGARGVGGMLAS